MKTEDAIRSLPKKQRERMKNAIDKDATTDEQRQAVAEVFAAADRQADAAAAHEARGNRGHAVDTVTVVAKGGREEMVINAADFDPAKHTRVQT